MTFAEPSFPPLLNGRVVVKGDSPTALAVAGASSGELGAGDALWLQDTDNVELAIVLEPDDPLLRAAQMLPLALAAAGDSLATLCPPQVGIHFRWPGTFLLNGGAAGGCRLSVPDGCAPGEVPAWMVVSFALRFAGEEAAEPGTTPGITSLVEEGGEDLSTVDVLESFARHFLSLLDTWMNDGFADAAENWSARAEGADEDVEIVHPNGAVTGRVLGLDENGNLLVKPAGGGQTVALSLLECLERATRPEGAEP